MGLIMIVGSPGSGKTLFATCCIGMCHLPTHANFQTKFEYVDEFDLRMFLQGKYTKCSIVLDEAYVYLESRVSNRALNRVLSYILFQSRKRGLGIILTAQLDSTIDIRYRSLCDFYVLCSRESFGFVYDIWSIKRRVHRQIVLKENNAERVYPLFDTMEIIEPLEDVTRALPKSRASETKKIAKAVIATYPKAERITRAQITHYLEQHEYPNSLVDSVYVEIKDHARKNPKKSSNLKRSKE